MRVARPALTLLPLGNLAFATDLTAINLRPAARTRFWVLDAGAGITLGL